MNIYYMNLFSNIKCVYLRIPFFFHWMLVIWHVKNNSSVQQNIIDICCHLFVVERFEVSCFLYPP